MSKEKNFMETYVDLIEEKINRELETRPYKVAKFKYDPENCSWNKKNQRGPGIQFTLEEKNQLNRPLKCGYYFPIEEYPTPSKLFTSLENELMLFELLKMSKDPLSIEQAVILRWDSTTIYFRPAGKDRYGNLEFPISMDKVFDNVGNMDVDAFFQKSEEIILKNVDNYQRYNPFVYRGSSENTTSKSSENKPKRIILRPKFDYQDIEQVLNPNTENNTNNLETQFSKLTMNNSEV